MVSSRRKIQLLSLLQAMDDDEEIILLLELISRNKYAHSWEWSELFIGKSLDFQFHNNFKLSKKEFSHLCNTICAHDTATPLDCSKEILFIFIYYCSRSITYRYIGDKFGRSTHYCRSCIKYIAGILYNLRASYICLPQPEEFPLLDAQWQRFSELKGTLLAIDGTHITITTAAANSERYVNRHSDFFDLLFSFM
ncbi:hypothetical protein ENBRE01_3007 [Enteropsectra breve]|nr:hypothetical protein ENBRE01_3007 [Enteropsectra breve]